MNGYPRAFAKCAAVVALVWLTCLPLGAFGTYYQPSYDTVPRSSWIYDAFARLSADGVLGDLDVRDFAYARLYNRVEMAAMLIDLAEQDSTLSATQQQIALQLADEFRSEIRFLTGSDLDAFSGASDTLDTGIVWASGEVRREAGDDTTLAAGSASYLGLRGRSVNFGATLSNSRRLISPDESHLFAPKDRFHYRSRGRDWSWEVGKGYTWLGTSQTGSLWLGDASPSMYLARADNTLSLGKLLGRWRFDAQVAGFREEDRTFYVLSKSMRKTISPNWTVGVLDLVKTTTTPNPLMFVVPFQAYQAWLLDDIDRKWNGMMGVEAIYHPSQKYEIYGQFMVDDLSNPFDPGPTTPKKTGLLIGTRYRCGRLLSGGPRYQLEYASVDARAYEATRFDVPLLSWTQDSLPLAWPFQNDVRSISLSAEGRIAPCIDLKGGFMYLDRKSGPGYQQLIYAEPAWRVCNIASLALHIARHSGESDHWTTSLRATAWY